MVSDCVEIKSDLFRYIILLLHYKMHLKYALNKLVYIIIYSSDDCNSNGIHCLFIQNIASISRQIVCI
jgi:hypothetical protein